MTTLFRPDLISLLGALAVTAASGVGGGDEEGTTADGDHRSGPRIVACTLGAAEQRERAAAIRRELVPRIRAIDEQPNGYVLWFDRGDGELGRIARFVELESRCCAFLDFTIRVGAGGDRVALHVDGPPGTKEFLEPLVAAQRGAAE